MIRKTLAATALALTLTGCGAGALPPVPAAAPLTPVTSSGPTNSPSLPTRVDIPALGITDEITPVGLAPDRTMEIPPVDLIGWYDRGPIPGEPGPAVLAGHVNYEGVPGTFGRIGELDEGDLITVTEQTGIARTFSVYDVATRPKAQFDAPLIFGDRASSELVLVTCSGEIVGRNYQDNTIVSARLLEG